MPRGRPRKVKTEDQAQEKSVGDAQPVETSDLKEVVKKSRKRKGQVDEKSPTREPAPAAAEKDGAEVEEEAPLKSSKLAGLIKIVIEHW